MGSLLRVLLGSFGLLMMVVACQTEKRESEMDYLDRMEVEHKDDKPVVNAAVDLPASSDERREVSSETVVYATVNGKDIEGYLAKAENGQGNNPGIIVIHEWWGLNDNIRMMTDKLAGLGYTALAVDLYNGKVADTPDKAGQYARSVTEDQAIDNLKQAYSYLSDKEQAPKVGTIGWCFGGGWSLQTALALPDKVDATVIYYGRLVTDKDQLDKLSMPVIGFFGAEDQGITPESAHEFESVMKSLDKNISVYIYEGANHAFANPSGTRYNQKAAEDAWQKTTKFFAEYLK